MKFTKTQIDGAYVITLQPRQDERGELTRTWCKKEFSEHAIHFEVVQGYTSYTKRKGTLRGIHYQIAPQAEAKLTRCLKGSLYEVIIDLRKDSKTYMKWLGFEFRANTHNMLFLPAYCAHAVLTLEDDTDYINFSDKAYHHEYERGIRYDDPSFSINWPREIEIISSKDLSWPLFKQ